MKWQELVACIPHGEVNAIHMENLAALLGMTAAGVKGAVRRARPEAEKEGVTIASSRNGYFIPDGPDEKAHYIFLMRKQSRTRLETIGDIRTED